MIKYIKFQLTCLVTALASTTSLAQESTPGTNTKPAQEASLVAKHGLEFLVSAGLTIGGDDLIEIQVNDGPDEELKAGGLFDLRAGTAYRFQDSPFALQFSLGYHFDTVSGEDTAGRDADFTFSRITYELLSRYHINKHQLGLGVIQHTQVELELDGLGLKGNIDYNDATGLVVEYAYWLNPKVYAALRYVDINYKPSDELTLVGGAQSQLCERDGSHFGVYATLHF